MQSRWDWMMGRMARMPRDLDGKLHMANGKTETQKLLGGIPQMSGLSDFHPFRMKGGRFGSENCFNFNSLSGLDKPLKRLTRRRDPLHRAKARC
jgi:hypothetical protein